MCECLAAAWALWVGCELTDVGTLTSLLHRRLLQSASRPRAPYPPARPCSWSCGVALYVMLVGSLPFQDPAHPNSYPKMVEVRCCVASLRVGRGLLAWRHRLDSGIEAPSRPARLKPCEPSSAPSPGCPPLLASQRIGRVQYHLPSQLQLSPGCVDMIQRIFVHVSQCISCCCAADTQRRGS